MKVICAELFFIKIISMFYYHFLKIFLLAFLYLLVISCFASEKETRSRLLSFWVRLLSWVLNFLNSVFLVRITSE